MFFLVECIFSFFHGIVDVIGCLHYVGDYGGLFWVGLVLAASGGEPMLRHATTREQR
jgi:hypothetical protein